MKSKKNLKEVKQKEKPKSEAEPMTSISEVEKKVKLKNIEKFIHITEYNDYTSMDIIKSLFEQINKLAFKLNSSKEIYSKELSIDEKQDNSIDYISGFQILDHNIRITIIEGVSKKSIEIVKASLALQGFPYENKKIYSNRNVLFEERRYSSFGLSLKYIKLRKNLCNILTEYDIYSKADRQSDVFKTFMDLSAILRGPTLEILDLMKVFPSYDSLLLLERYYSDILNKEDMTGKSNEKSKKNEEINENSLNNSQVNEKNEVIVEKTRKISRKSKTNSKNPDFQLKKSEKSRKNRDFHKENQFFLEKLVENNKKQGKSFEKFCLNKVNDEYKGVVYQYSGQRLNYWSEYMNRQRMKYEKDNNNFYCFSKKYLTLMLPMTKNTNVSYEEYVNNKKKWICDKDFFVSKPESERIYFPRINRKD